MFIEKIFLLFLFNVLRDNLELILKYDLLLISIFLKQHQFNFMQEQKINILLVEYNKADQHLIESLLLNKNEDQYTLFFAETIQEAIEKAKLLEIKVTILNLELPGSQGLENFAQFHQQFPELPVILISNLDDNQLSMKALKQGAQDFFYKSKIDSHLLVQSIHRAIERHKLIQSLHQTNFRLTERMKELHCLLSLSKIVEGDESLEDFFKRLLDIIPPGWQYPEITCARLIFKDQIFASANFKETPWQLKTSIYKHKKEIGSIEVFYLEKKPESDLGPFLNEEKNLLEAIAERAGKIIERKNAEESLLLFHEELRAKEEQLLAQNEELQVKEEELITQNEELASQNEELLTREEELQKLSKRYIELFNNSPSGISVYSVENNGNDFIFSDFNKQSETMHQIKKEAVIGKNVVNVFPGIVEMGLLEIFKEVWQTGNPAFQSNTFYNDKNIQGWRENLVYKLSSKEIVAIYNDTTDKVQRENDLLLTQFFIDNTSSAAALADKYANYIYVNKSYCNIAGYTLEEFSKKHVYDVNLNLTKELWPDFWLKTKEKGAVVFESQLITKNKLVKDTRISANFITFNNNEYIFAIIEDITEKKKSETLRMLYSMILENLNNSKDVLKTIYSIINNLQTSLDIDAIGIRLREGFDYPYLNTCGFSKQFVESENSLCYRNENNEIILDNKGKPLLQCVCGAILRQEIDFTLPIFSKYGTLCINELQDFLATYPDVVKNIKMRGMCITEGFESLLLIPILREDDFVGLLHLCSYKKNQFSKEFVNFMENIATSIGIAINKHNLQQQLILEKNTLDFKVSEKTTELKLLIEELEEVNRHKSQFLNNMSHELRTPLNAILGFSQSLEKQYFGTLNDKQLEYIKLIKDSGDHLLTLINDILDFAKIDAGKIEVNKAVLSTSKFIKTTIAMVSTLFKDKDIDLDYHIDEDATELFADNNLLKQILLNLLSNALKFTNPGGKVLVNVEKYENTIRFSIIDNGIGINPEDQEKIFEEFYQTKYSINQATGGTGIGLALTKKLVTLHGGDIGVVSEPGKGSTFWFTIPNIKVPAFQ